MILIPAIIFFGFGLIIGSFLNVVILRLGTSKSFGGRSACMSCASKLSWHELVPVLSFLWLLGRCRYCQTRISPIYPLVELATGLIFLSLFLKFQDIFLVSTFAFTTAYAYYTLMFCLLLVIAAYDVRHKIIPDVPVFLFGVLGFVGLFFFSVPNSFIGFYPRIPSLLELLSGFLLALPFFLLWLLSKGAWMGLGDAKLALGLGFLLGLPMALSAMVVAFWSGAVVGIIMVASQRARQGMKSEIPFAPFLVLGAFLAFIFELNLFQISL